MLFDIILNINIEFHGNYVIERIESDNKCIKLENEIINDKNKRKYTINNNYENIIENTK